MAYNKKNEFNNREIKLANYAKVLSHPARIMILMALAERNCICGEIVDKLPLSQSTVSKHLNDLKKVGLIIGEIDGPRSCYYINWEKVDELSIIFEELLKNLKDAHKD